MTQQRRVLRGKKLLVAASAGVVVNMTGCFNFGVANLLALPPCPTPTRQCPERDAGVVDAGTAQTDAGTTHSDAGTTHSDAGVVDAGTTHSDAGVPDAG